MLSLEQSLDRAFQLGFFWGRVRRDIIMSTLCFGGSFNPIHNGHLACARAVAEARGFGRVLLIPNGQPPHKGGAADLAEGKHRLAMCEGVAAEEGLFAVDDLEMRRNGPSYTIDTVRELERRGFGRVNWLIGADMLNELPKWGKAGELIQKVGFLIVARPGFEFDWARLPQSFQGLRQCVVEAPRVDVSASEIRSRVRAGEGIGELVPAVVERYIREHRLYL